MRAAYGPPCSTRSTRRRGRRRRRAASRPAARSRRRRRSARRRTPCSSSALRDRLAQPVRPRPPDRHDQADQRAHASSSDTVTGRRPRSSSAGTSCATAATVASRRVGAAVVGRHAVVEADDVARAAPASARARRSRAAESCPSRPGRRTAARRASPAARAAARATGAGAPQYGGRTSVGVDARGGARSRRPRDRSRPRISARLWRIGSRVAPEVVAELVTRARRARPPPRAARSTAAPSRKNVPAAAVRLQRRGDPGVHCDGPSSNVSATAGGAPAARVHDRAGAEHRPRERAAPQPHRGPSPRARRRRAGSARRPRRAPPRVRSSAARPSRNATCARTLPCPRTSPRRRRTPPRAAARRRRREAPVVGQRRRSQIAARHRQRGEQRRRPGAGCGARAPSAARRSKTYCSVCVRTKQSNAPLGRPSAGGEVGDVASRARSRDRRRAPRARSPRDRSGRCTRCP